MKKGWIFSIVGLLIVGIGAYFLLAQPKLNANVAGTTGDKKSVVIDLDNKGIRPIKLKEVVINGDAKPDIAKLQGNGEHVVISDTFDEKDIHFYNYQTTPILPTEYRKDGTREIHSGYYLSLHDKTKIHSVDMTYTYLGKTFHSGIVLD